MSVRLTDIASVIRSKNAGPGELTLDIVFDSRDWYERVVARGVFSRELVAALYGVDEASVLTIIPFEPAAAVKITIRRPLVSGAIGDGDIYGAQQHAPLLGLTLEGLED